MLKGKDIEDRLVQLIQNNSFIEANEDDSVIFPEVDEIRTFKEAHLLITDNGVVISCKDGSEIYLTIQVIERR